MGIASSGQPADKQLSSSQALVNWKRCLFSLLSFLSTLIGRMKISGSDESKVVLQFDANNA